MRTTTSSRRLPEMTAFIDRRILVNFTVDPDVARRILPEPFRPNLSFGPALAGICLIRLTGVRPAGTPRWAALSSENAAHRMAVEWDTPNGVATGVYVWRRDTDSLLATVCGGRVFPGDQHRAVFGVRESPGRYSVAATSADGRVSLAFDGHDTDALPSASVFTGLDSASAFFRCDAVGYSPSRHRAAPDGLRLDTDGWKVSPLAADYVQSSFFEDRDQFPRGSVAYDHTLVMRGVAARWSAAPRLGAAADPRAVASYSGIAA